MRRAMFLAIFVGSIVIAVVDLLYIILLYITQSGTVLSFLVPSIIAAGMLAALFLPRWSVGEFQAPPERVYAQLAHGLRQAQHRVEEKQDCLLVHVGRWTAVKVWVEFERGGTRLRYQFDATPSGWGLIILLVILFEVNVVAPVVILYVFAQEERFENRVLLPLASAIRTLPEVAPEPDVHSMLVDGLAEAHRLAAEAWESERSSLQDFEAIIFFGGVVVWILTLLVIVIGVPPTEALRQGSTPLLASFLMAGAVVAVPLVLLRRRFRPRILEYGSWALRLREALAREASRRPARPDSPSAFEILAQGSTQVPEWVDARRRTGLSRDPASGFLLLGMIIWAFTLFEGVWVGLGYGLAYALLFLAGAVLLSFGAFEFYRRWKRKSDESYRQELLEWRQRLDRVRALMEQYLDGL